MAEIPPFPPQALAQHTAILGKTGSGKTSTAKLAVEQVVACLACIVLRAAATFIFRGRNAALKAIVGALLIAREEMRETPKPPIDA